MGRIVGSDARTMRSVNHPGGVNDARKINCGRCLDSIRGACHKSTMHETTPLDPWFHDAGESRAEDYCNNCLCRVDPDDHRCGGGASNDDEADDEGGAL